MPKPIRRLSSKFFNVIYSTFSSSRSVLSTSSSTTSSSSPTTLSNNNNKEVRLTEKSPPVTTTPATMTTTKTTTTITTTTTTKTTMEQSSSSSTTATEPPVVSEFPDEETAKLLETVPSQNELISFDELEKDDSCLNCLDPCNSHSNYSNSLMKKIDFESPLNNTVKPYIRHVLISTGKGDWETNIEDEPDSFANNLHKTINDYKLKKINNNNNNNNININNNSDNNNNNNNNDNNNNNNNIPHQHENTDRSRVIITNSSRKNTEINSSGNDVLIFPENILIKNITTNQVKNFYKRFLLPKEEEEKIEIVNEDNNDNDNDIINYDDDNFIVEKMPYKSVIVICSHKKRDKRCGITGPILKKEFDKVLKEKGLDVETCKNDGVGVFLSSHTGGHRFAGNVIVYKEGKGIWYGRVIPCHAKNIIENTIIEGKVIKDLYRGSMNGSFAPDCGSKKIFDW